MTKINIELDQHLMSREGAHIIIVDIEKSVGHIVLSLMRYTERDDYCCY